MSQENLEIVQRLFDSWPGFHDALAQGTDISSHPWLSLWHPDCVLEEMAAIPDAATYHGRAEITRYFQQLGDAFDEIGYVPLEIIVGADGVFVTTEMSGRSKAGVDVQMHVFQVFRLRDGMIFFVTGYLDRAEALKAVGLAS